MASIFRSETMVYAQLFLHTDSTYACIRELGELGKIQFIDLNSTASAFQRKFVNEVRRCDEMERKLRFLDNELEKAKIPAIPSGNVEAPDPQHLIDLEFKFHNLEQEVKEINVNKQALKRNLLDLKELHHILEKTAIFFREAGRGTMVGAMEAETREEKKGIPALLHEKEMAEINSATKFTFITGVIPRERLPVFERVLWRVCHGNVFLREAEIEEYLEDPSTGELVSKSVFILFFQGDQLRTRVKKICEGFSATLYQCPETRSERDKMRRDVTNRINDLENVLRTTNDHSNTQLVEIAQRISEWQQVVIKMKSIYHTMNKFSLDTTRQCLIAECWCPEVDMGDIQDALRRGTERSGSTVPCIVNRMRTNLKRPTHFKTNELTGSFQAIVDAYGIASYQEVNPTPYTIITFPFLFAVMFGDAGHGFLMFLFALALLIFQEKLRGVKDEMFSMLFNGRYLLLLMGIFSMYTGLIYNDVYAKPLNIFGSNWRPYYYGLNITLAEEQNITSLYNSFCAPVGSVNTSIECNPQKPSTSCNYAWCSAGSADTKAMCTLPTEAQLRNQPYPFGLDPMWAIANNKLIFTNPYKMKMSIVLGVMQMLFGVILSVINYIYFKKYIRIVAEFIPQVIFLMSMFGWLILLITWKWISYYPDATKCPNLLITLIYMFLKFTSTSPDGETEFSVFGPTTDVAEIQSSIQKILVLLMVVCVPWMLLMKPLYVIFQRKMKEHTHGVSGDGLKGKGIEAKLAEISGEKGKPAEKPAAPVSVGGGEHGDDVPIGELFVYQSIHTIEYCLGTISNTASYLRLWALGLAHQQLAEVLWTMVLNRAISQAAEDLGFGVVAVFGLWAFWAVLTVSILLVMEALSAFLHALRLHWIEFQNKFYEGEGVEFKPFSFVVILSGKAEDV